jgi:tetratricopeptide (TPR) repeat protein
MNTRKNYILLAALLIQALLHSAPALAATLAEAKQHVIAGDYAQAIATFEQVRKDAPQTITPLDGDQFGAVYGMANDPSGHFEHCQWFFKTFPLKDTTDAATAERIAKAYVICSTATDKKLLKKAEEYTRFAADKGRNDQYAQWFFVAHGITHYRIQNYEESSQWLRRALDNPDPNIRSLAFAYQAMNIHHRGYTDKAIGLLNQAEAAFAQLAKPGTPEYASHWSNVLTSKLAIDEAKALMGQ